MTRLDEDPDVRVGVLTFAGDHTTAGLDMPLFFGPDAGPQRIRRAEPVDPFGLRRRLTKPLVSAVQGITFTIGIEIPLAGDIVVAASDARFCQLEPKRGLAPLGGATIRDVQRAGWGNAMYHLLTADEFSAAEAYRIGLVQEVVDPGQQVDRALAIAAEIATCARWRSSTRSPTPASRSTRTSRPPSPRSRRSARRCAAPPTSRRGSPRSSSVDRLAHSGTRSAHSVDRLAHSGTRSAHSVDRLAHSGTRSAHSVDRLLAGLTRGDHSLAGSQRRSARSLGDSLGSQRRSARSLEDSLGSQRRSARSLEDSLGSQRRSARSLEDSLGSHNVGPMRLLQDVVVLDLGDEATALAGEYLSELGAEVIRVEDVAGDVLRRRGGHWHHVHNAGKRSVAIDPADDAAWDRIAAALPGIDVVIGPLEPTPATQRFLDRARATRRRSPRHRRRRRPPRRPATARHRPDRSALPAGSPSSTATVPTRRPRRPATSPSSRSPWPRPRRRWR